MAEQQPEAPKAGPDKVKIIVAVVGILLAIGGVVLGVDLKALVCGP